MVSKILMRRLLVDRIRLFLLEEIALSSLLMLVYLTLNDISTRSIINLCLSVLNISIGYDSGLARWSIYLLLPSFTSDIIIQANILRWLNLIYSVFHFIHVHYVLSLNIHRIGLELLVYRISQFLSCVLSKLTGCSTDTIWNRCMLLLWRCYKLIVRGQLIQALVHNLHIHPIIYALEILYILGLLLYLLR